MFWNIAVSFAFVFVSVSALTGVNDNDDVL
jgi:hypothetical protein